MGEYISSKNGALVEQDDERDKNAVRTIRAITRHSKRSSFRYEKFISIVMYFDIGTWRRVRIKVLIQ